MSAATPTVPDATPSHPAGDMTLTGGRVVTPEGSAGPT